MSLWEVMLVEHHKLLGASAKTSCNMRPEHWDLNINHINVTRPQHNHIFCLRSQHKTLSRYWIRRNLTLLGAHYFCCLGYANFPLRILIRAERRSRVGKNSNEKIAWQRGVLRSRLIKLTREWIQLVTQDWGSDDTRHWRSGKIGLQIIILTWDTGGWPHHWFVIGPWYQISLVVDNSSSMCV